MAVKVMRPGSDGKFIGYDSWFFKGLEYAVSKGAIVSNHSYGGGFLSTSQKTKYNNFANNNPNHLTVYAAGNSNILVTSTSYACGMDMPTQICVAASTNSDSKASFSNYGKDLVDVYAPGQQIASTTPNNGYQYKSGTSMASPQVAGLAALIRSMKTMTAMEAKNFILDNVQVKSQYANDVGTSGLIDAFASVNAVGGGGSGGNFFFFIKVLSKQKFISTCFIFMNRV